MEKSKRTFGPSQYIITWTTKHACVLNCSVMSDSLQPMDCSPPGSFAHGILQAKILEGVAIASSKGSSQNRDQTYISCGSCIDRWILYHQATWET